MIRKGVLAFVLGLVASATAVAAPPPEWIGAEACGACHPQAYEAWRTGAHARSLSSLSAGQAADPACRTCHTMAPGESDERFSGVQCESCHGGGRLYAPEHVMRDPVLATAYGLVDVDEKVCAACHRSGTPAIGTFVLEDAMARVCVNRLPPPERSARP
ncbi:MAG: hypothetical protein HC923_12865 [Myxococcales bacterium]|nr:hypothetical protein [Myxococcales bacterium]